MARAAEPNRLIRWWKVTGADAVGAREAKAVPPLAPGQTDGPRRHAVFAPILGSWPLMRRRMFSWCR